MPPNLALAREATSVSHGLTSHYRCLPWDSLAVEGPRDEACVNDDFGSGSTGLFLLGIIVLTSGLKAYAGSGPRTTLRKAVAPPVIHSGTAAIKARLVTTRAVNLESRTSVETSIGRPSSS